MKPGLTNGQCKLCLKQTTDKSVLKIDLFYRILLSSIVMWRHETFRERQSSTSIMSKVIGPVVCSVDGEEKKTGKPWPSGFVNLSFVW